MTETQASPATEPATLEAIAHDRCALWYASNALEDADYLVHGLTMMLHGEEIDSAGMKAIRSLCEVISTRIFDTKKEIDEVRRNIDARQAHLRPG